MAIEAIASVGQKLATSQTGDVAQQAVTQGKSSPATGSGDHASVVFQRATGLSETGSSFASNLANQVYGTINKVGVELPKIGSGQQNAVDQAMKSLLPENSAISPVKTPAAMSGNESLAALSKTFDHAVFMAMVNQVVSGVSDTSRTLIKQA